MNDISIPKELASWVSEIQKHCQAKDIVWIDGSDNQIEQLTQELIKKGTFVQLEPKLRPHSFLARSSVDDVQRVEERTFICSKNSDDAGITNNWKDPEVMRSLLQGLFKGCMKGRTLYVVPFCLCPIDSPLARFGVELTDSAYVVCNLHIMARTGNKVLEKMYNKPFVKALHSVGAPLEENISDTPWPCNPEQQYIAHFPETEEIWSFGSGYGGNALLSKKCFALRIGSCIAKREGWLAEHMLIIGVTNPQGVKKYFAAAFPSSCGKTNLALLSPTLPGWKVECLGDDIAWMYWKDDGTLWAINPEAGFFGIAPNTNKKTNPHAMETVVHHTIFTNVALTEKNDVWWEGMTPSPPANTTDWQGRYISNPDKNHQYAHPNARFTVSCTNCPILDPAWQNPEGVPISGIIFGGRRSTTIPLVREAKSWAHGILMGATMSSESTAAARGQLGVLKHDPFAMRPFCGYNIADYFSYWNSQETPHRKMPKIFFVNWFRKDDRGEYLWPGFGDNIRVIAWMFDRIESKVNVQSTPWGLYPYIQDINTRGLNITEDKLEKLFTISKEQWMQELEVSKNYLLKFREKIPVSLLEELQQEITETEFL